MFSKWLEVFPSKKADAETVAKALLAEIIPRWGIPVKLTSSDNGTHFNNELIKQVCKYLGMKLNFHTAYHPQSGGAVEKENATLKNCLAKCSADTGLSWVKCLPYVVMKMRMRERTKLKLSPFEIVFGRPPYTGIGPRKTPLPDSALCNDSLITYCRNLHSALQNIHHQVKEALPQKALGPLHNIRPGDFVLVKDFRRAAWNSERWRGPFQVLLVTETAVKVAERATWIHASHCKLWKGDPDEVPGAVPKTDAVGHSSEPTTEGDPDQAIILFSHSSHHLYYPQGGVNI